MSTAIAKNFQVGSDSTATNNFTIRQPATPDGTVRIANGNSGTTTDLVTVTSAGNVGVGTSTPAVKLDVVGTTTSALRLRSNSAASNGFNIYNDSSTDIAYLNNFYSGAMVFATNNTERMRLDSSGNLGLGVTPSAWDSSLFKVAQIGVTGAFISGRANAVNQAQFGLNTYYDGAYKYVANGNSTRYEQNTGAHYWYTAPSGTAGNVISFTQAMTLDASGRLGVGVTSPVNKFVVASSGVGYEIDQTSIANTNLLLSYDRGASVYRSVANYYGGTYIWNDSGTERARITSGGYLLVGTTSGIVAQTGVTSTHNISTNVDTGYGLTVSNTSGGAFGLGIKYTAHSPNNAGNSFVWCSDGGGTQRASIYSNGGLANYSGNNVNLSDRREKTNFAPAKDYLDTICAIPVQTFNYIDQSEDDPGTTLGVVAQDVQAVAPELVMESNWGTKEDPKMRLSIYQTDLQYALMKCIQELKAELDSVKTELALLKGTA